MRVRSDSSPPLESPLETIDGGLLMDPTIVWARTRETLCMLFRLASDPIRVLVSVLQPPSRVLASVLQPSASEPCGKVALVGGDGKGVAGGGLAGVDDCPDRIERSREGEADGFPVQLGLEGDDGTLTVWDELDRGRAAGGMIRDAGRMGRTGAERLLACVSSPSEASLVVALRYALATGAFAECSKGSARGGTECPVARGNTDFEDGGSGNSIFSGNMGLSVGVRLRSSLDADAASRDLSFAGVAEFLRSRLEGSSFLELCPNPNLEPRDLFDGGAGAARGAL